MDQHESLEEKLIIAVERGDFLLHYQPRVDLRTGRITEVEALVRWDEPELGMLTPMEFIPLAEETGLIVPIGEWVLRAACAQARLWQTQGLASLRVSVNVSFVQLSDNGFLRAVRDVLDATGLDANQLGLELTESTMPNVEHAFSMTHELREMGVRLGLDNFGTGYSSLSSLSCMPIDMVQVDRKFVYGVPNENEETTIVSSTIALAHELEMSVLAEGVETDAQLGWLRDHDCDMMQGYLLSRPVPADNITKLINNSRGSAASHHRSL